VRVRVRVRGRGRGRGMPPAPGRAVVVRPCAPVVMPTVAEPPPPYATELTTASTPATLARRSDAARAAGRLATVRASAVPPAVEPRLGLVRMTTGVAATE
jgi:hypothetical protein